MGREPCLTSTCQLEMLNEVIGCRREASRAQASKRDLGRIERGVVHRGDCGRKTTTADGNGAGLTALPKRSRPRTYRISLARATCSCHHRVSVRAGRRHTTVAPSLALSHAFLTQEPMVRPYGGFIQHVPVHCCLSESSAGLKNLRHLALVGSAQTSRVKPNSASSS